MNPASHQATQGAATPSDADLLRRYAHSRNEAAFAELVQRHLALVYSAALRQLNGASHRAEEVAQTVFTDLARKAVALSRRTDLAGWLYTSTHFAAAKLKRAEQRRQSHEQEAQLMNELSSDSSSDADWERLRPVLDDAMHDLNERDRDVILQRFFQGCRLAEVGEKLGLSEDAARMRVDRALDKLRALLARRQITSTTAALAVALANQPAVAVSANFAASMTGSALAAASVATAPAVSVFQIMSTSKIAASVAGLVLVLALGVATREISNRRAEEAALAVGNQDYAAQIAKLRGLEQHVQAAERDAAKLARAVEDARTAQAAAKARAEAEAKAAKAESTWDPVAEGRAFFARHPDAKAALVDWHRAAIDAKYGSLYRSLGFTSAQIEQFQTLMLDAQFETRNLGSQYRAIPLFAGEGPSPNLAEQLHLVLGADGFSQMAAIQQATSAGDTVAKLAGALCFTDEPLTGEQSGQLMQLLLANQAKGTGRRPSAADWDAVMASASGFLSTPQMTGLNDIRVKAQAFAASSALKAGSK